MALNERPDRDAAAPGGAQGVPRGCPDDERLAEYADGLLDAPARAAIEAHLVTCADCRFAIAETLAFLDAEAAPAVDEDEPAPGATAVTPLASAAPGAVAASSADAAPAAGAQADAAAGASSTASSPSTPVRVVPFRKRPWVTGVGAALAAAASLVLIVRLTEPVWLPSWLTGGPPIEVLEVALDHQRVRPVEGRLMTWNGFAYKPAPSPTRGGDDKLGRGWSPEVTIATTKLEKFAEGSTSVNARAALGLALIVDGDLDRAIAELEAAAKEMGRMHPNPMVNVNLSAAYLARARWWNHPEDWSKAAAAAEQAISVEGSAPEPYFNLALALEGLGQTARAAEAFAIYASLDRDPNSGWTREAEERRKALLAR